MPGLGKAKICPIKAMKKLLTIYFPVKNQPLFQYKYPSGWKVLIDSKVWKTWTYLNTKLGYPPHYFTFHSFQKSGASLPFFQPCPPSTNQVSRNLVFRLCLVLHTFESRQCFSSSNYFFPPVLYVKIFLHILL